MGLDVRAIDHLNIRGSSFGGTRAKHPLPNPAFRPAHETIINRGGRTVFRRAIAPTAATLDDVQNAADNSSVINPLLAPYILRQIRFDHHPLFVTQPEKVAPQSIPRKSPSIGNQQPIQAAILLLGFGPSITVAFCFCALRV